MTAPCLPKEKEWAFALQLKGRKGENLSLILECPDTFLQTGRKRDEYPDVASIWLVVTADLECVWEGDSHVFCDATSTSVFLRALISYEKLPRSASFLGVRSRLLRGLPDAKRPVRARVSAQGSERKAESSPSAPKGKALALPQPTKQQKSGVSRKTSAQTAQPKPTQKRQPPISMALPSPTPVAVPSQENLMMAAVTKQVSFDRNHCLFE